MKLKNIPRIGNLKADAFYSTIAEGLNRICAHIRGLSADLDAIVNASSNSDVPATGGNGATILAGVVDEEAAKFCILLDAVRCRSHGQKALSDQLHRCYDHLAKGIYIRAYEARPGDFAEIERLVANCRRTLYLDGPNDVDFIFGNDIVRERAESLYVDYVSTIEEGDMWWPVEDSWFASVPS